MMDQLLFAKRDTAKLLGLSIRTIEYLLERHELDSVRVGRRRLVKRNSILAFIRRDHPKPVSGGNQ